MLQWALSACVFFSFGFLRVYGWNLHTIFYSDWINLHSHQQHKRFSFSPTPSPAFIVCRLFDDGHSDQGEVIFHCSFDLHFSTNEWYWAFFHVVVSHLYLFFGEMCFGLFPTFWLGCLFFWYWVVWADFIFWKLTFVSCFICYYFLPFWGLSFHLV